MADKVAVARRLMTLLSTRAGTPMCFRCLDRELGVRRVVIEALAVGAAATLSNMQVGPAVCGTCDTRAQTVRYVG